MFNRLPFPSIIFRNKYRNPYFFGTDQRGLADAEGLRHWLQEALHHPPQVAHEPLPPHPPRGACAIDALVAFARVCTVEEMSCT